MRNNQSQSLAKVELVAQLFIERLTEKKLQLARIASFWNSFEGWLKWELASAAYEKWERRPWKSQNLDAEWLTIGVEYKALLKTRRANRARKQIDLWICPDDSGEHVYVEIKVVFNNGHRDKQFASAREDLAFLKGVEPEKLAGGLVFVVAVGFEEADQKICLDQPGGKLTWLVDAQTGIGPDETPSVAILTFAV